MLYALGPLSFEVAPFNVHDLTRESEAGFAEKAVIGRRPPLEFVGDGNQNLSFNGRLFPQKFGGLEGLAVLDAMRQSGVPHFLMRGDGTPLGWFVVSKVRERSNHLDAKGIGRMIEFELELRRADAPLADNYVTALFELL